MRTYHAASFIFTIMLLSGCGGSSGSASTPALTTSPSLTTPDTTPSTTPSTSPQVCTEIGVSESYACRSGASEPLYAYQWALQLSQSFFYAFPSASQGRDLNIENAHLAGIKGQGVRVLVLDDGIEVAHEDLAANIDATMTAVIAPVEAGDAHGTSVAGIIAAAQNGKGIMGIAPRVILGGANFLSAKESPSSADAYGGATWSSSAHVINASFGSNPESPPSFDTAAAGVDQTAIRALPHLRGGKGLVYVKATGNEFDGDSQSGRACPSEVQGAISCENPAHDTDTLETNVIAVAAANARGIKSSYSSAGSINWITGLGGEYGNGGSHGQTGDDDGPVIITTDLIGCTRGYSETSSKDSASLNDFLKGLSLNKAGNKENANCDYGMINGTSAATPTITGIVALMLSANPALSWRDVREILRATAKKIDPNYGQTPQRKQLLDLSLGSFSTVAVGSSADLKDGASLARVEYGWQKNAAGYEYANAYGFGLADAAAAVNMAKKYAGYRAANLNIPEFKSGFSLKQLSYGRVTRLGHFSITESGQVDAVQIRLSGPVCIGSVGVFVRSPAGTVSALSVPYNIYYNTGNNEVSQYGLSSYAFFGELKTGNWEVFLVSGTPTNSGTGACSATPSSSAPLSVEYRILDRI